MARRKAKQQQLPLAVMTFNRHASMLFDSQNKASFRYLTSLKQKIELMRMNGVDILYVVDFNLSFAQLTPQRFIDQYIVGLASRVVVAGYDYTFGKFGLADMNLMKNYSHGRFDTVIVSKLEEGRSKVSSTRIRKLIERGDLFKATQLLGHSYFSEGELINGEKLLLFNNLQQLPSQGSYECIIKVQSKEYQVIVNVNNIMSATNGKDSFIDVLPFENNLPELVRVKLLWQEKVESNVKYFAKTSNVDLI
nr:FAD synthetase family protein [Liquorilactobacillus mali]